MKVTQLAGSSCWASRQDAQTKEFTRIEIHSAEDVSQLTINDNIFVAGDDVSDAIGKKILAHAKSLGATLLQFGTNNSRVTRFWLAPPKK